MALSPMDIIDDSIGAITYGTKVNPAPAVPTGTPTTIATITLNKGKYIINAGGITPIPPQGSVPNHPNNIGDQASTIGIVGQNITTSLTYVFSICGIINVTSDNQTFYLEVAQWESASPITVTTNYSFYAIKIA